MNPTAMRTRAAADRPKVQAPSGASGVRCGSCGREHTSELWRRLAVVQRINATRVRGHVTSWPGDVAIEIRLCPSCGGPIARKESH